MLLRWLMLLVLLLPTPAKAVTLFTEDFESSLGALQAKYACSYGSPFVDGAAQDWDSTQKFAGTYALKQSYAGSQYDSPPQGGGSCEFDFADQTQSEIWITWYHRFGTGFQTAGGGGVGGVATKGIYMYMKSLSTGAVHGWVFHYFYGGQSLTMSAQGIKDHKGPNGPGTGTAIPYDTENMWQNIQAYDQPDGQWVCYEARYKLNTPGQADGGYQLYITPPSGVAFLAASHMNREFLDTTPSGQSPSDSRWFRFKFYRQDGLGDMWYDNTSVTSTRLGCSGGPPTGDTVAPVQVTGLTAVSNTTTSTLYTWTANAETDLQSYIVEGCTGAACSTFTTIGTVPAGTTTFNATGRTANTLYRVRVKAQDTSNNIGTASSIVDDTTDAASSLPTVTGFTSTATGGTITYTGTPTDFRIPFGGTNGDGTFWNSQIIRTLAAVPGGVLSFNWPTGTSWACVHARDAVAAEDPVAYVCAGVTPAPPGGTPSGTYLRRLSSNPRWLTLDGTTALYRVGISGGNNCNASFCGLQDLTSSNSGFTQYLTISTVISDTFDGTAADIGTAWTGGYTGGIALEKSSGVVKGTAAYDAVEARSEFLFGNQFAQGTIGSITGAGAMNLRVMVNMSDPGGDLNGYACGALRNGGGQTARIDRVTAGVSTTLVSENATTWAANDTIQCRRVGKNITLYRNGSQLLTTTDATYRQGKVGILIFAATPADGTFTAFTGGPVVADYVAALDAVVNEGGNWVRYWTLEQSAWGFSDISTGDEITIPFTQFPWTWTGVTRTITADSTTMTVGVYDVTTLNQSFFDRVSNRVDAALSRGITPIITMFSAGHLAYAGITSGFSNPFYAGNNINGISCDTNASGQCEELHDYTNGSINNAHLSYVCKLVQTIGNRAVILEVDNEPQSDSTTWQNAMMEQVRTCETLHGTNAHIIFQSGWGHTTNYPAGLASSSHLFSNSRNDAVSPLCTSDGANWDTNPSANDGTKLIFYDSDHTGYNDTCGTWTAIVPWKLFTRAIYPIFLSERESAGVQTAIKTAMAQANLYSTKINLATAYPENGGGIISTGYGLFTGTNSTTPNCSEYLMLLTADGSGSIDLTACSAGATFNVETLNLTSGAIASAGTTTGGASRSFNPAGTDPMVVYLKLDSVADTTPPVLSCTTSPAGVLAAGTTSVTVTCTTNENATVKMDSSPDVAYASQSTTFGTTGGVAHSQSVGSLSDGTSYTRYVRASDGTNATTVDYPVSWSVAAAAASTVPADVTNVRGTLNGTSGTIAWQWDAVSGADHYVIEISQGVTFLTAIETANAATFYQQGSLTVGTYIARVKAVNSANQESLNWALSTPVNAEHPPTVTGLYDTAPGVYTTTIVLSWDQPTGAGIMTILERGTGSSCVDADFTVTKVGSAVSMTDSSVVANTTYCYRAKFSNPQFGGISQSWSSTLYVTTRAASSGALAIPRIPVPFGQPRLPAQPRLPRN